MRQTTVLFRNQNQLHAYSLSFPHRVTNALTDHLANERVGRNINSECDRIDSETEIL